MVPGVSPRLWSPDLVPGASSRFMASGGAGLTSTSFAVAKFLSGSCKCPRTKATSVGLKSSIPIFPRNSVSATPASKPLMIHQSQSLLSIFDNRCSEARTRRSLRCTESENSPPPLGEKRRQSYPVSSFVVYSYWEYVSQDLKIAQGCNCLGLKTNTSVLVYPCTPQVPSMDSTRLLFLQRIGK